jgi:hypothetical protein
VTAFVSRLGLPQLSVRAVEATSSGALQTPMDAKASQVFAGWVADLSSFFSYQDCQPWLERFLPKKAHRFSPQAIDSVNP